MLLPGTYTFRFTAEGYNPLTIPNVVVTAGAVTNVDAPMYPVGTDVADQGADSSGRLALSQPSPNPFNNEAGTSGSVSMHLSLPQGFSPAGDWDRALSIGVFDPSGRQIRTLQMIAGPRPGGSLLVNWDGKDTGGLPVAPGVYWVQAQAGERPRDGGWWC